MFKPYDYFITPEDFEMAKKNGVKPNTLIARIRRYGWSKEKRSIRRQSEKTTVAIGQRSQNRTESNMEPFWPGLLAAGCRKKKLRHVRSK